MDSSRGWDREDTSGAELVSHMKSHLQWILLIDWYLFLCLYCFVLFFSAIIHWKPAAVPHLASSPFKDTVQDDAMKDRLFQTV